MAVSWGDASYTVTEGSGVKVTVLVDDDPEKRILVPIFSVGVGATGADYSVPSVVAFNAGETSATITLLAIEDEIDDDDESVRLSFGPVLPEGVTQGTPSTTEVFITDNDLAGDRLMSLVVAPKDIDGFDPEVTDYMVGMTSTVMQATITATPAQQDSIVAPDGADHRGHRDLHWGSLRHPGLLGLQRGQDRRELDLGGGRYRDLGRASPDSILDREAPEGDARHRGASLRDGGLGDRNPRYRRVGHTAGEQPRGPETLGRDLHDGSHHRHRCPGSGVPRYGNWP